MPGFIAFKGPDADIDVIERLITKISDISQGEANLKDILADTSGENEQLKTFAANLDDFWDLTEFGLVFDRSEKTLDIEYDLDCRFPVEEWAGVLNETFPRLSFFIVGDIDSGEMYGAEWEAYQDGICVGSEDHVCYLEDIDELDEGWEDKDDLLEELMGEISDCAIELAKAELSVWKLNEDDPEQLKKAQDAAQAARHKLEAAEKRLSNAPPES